MNILLIYYEPIPAGQTTHVLALARELARRHRVTVVLPSQLSTLERWNVGTLERWNVQNFKPSNFQTFKVVPLPMHKLLWPPRAVAALARLIRREQMDVVHIHSQEAGMLGRIVAWLVAAIPFRCAPGTIAPFRCAPGTVPAELDYRAPRANSHPPTIVYTPQTIDIRRARWHWVYARIEVLLARLTGVVISVNEADRARMIRWGIPASKVVTIPNGIELDEFAAPETGAGSRESETPGAAEWDIPAGASLRSALGLAPHKPLVIQVARLSAQKDPLAFVEGAAQVLRQRPDAQFALAGEGPLKELVIKRIGALGLEGCCHVLGWQPRAHTLMAAADVVTLTSRWEGSPYTLLEAMAAARPVVATDVNGCPEIVVDGVTGYVVPRGDPAAWAARVSELLRNPIQARAMGQAGRKRVEEYYTLQRMVAAVEQVYK